MKFKFLLIIFLGIFPILISAQNEPNLRQGKVSFVSSQHIYVLFESTEGIHAGDTLFIKTNQQLIPVLKVNAISSISCMTDIISPKTLSVNDLIYATIKVKQKNDIPIEVKAQKQNEAIDVNNEIIKHQSEQKKRPTRIDGHISVSSYSYGYNDSVHNVIERLRYTLALDANRIAGTKLSAESYLTFTHRLGESPTSYDGLKVYSLALNYDLTKQMQVSAGRKINSYIANIGAMDGAQFEYHKNQFVFGATGGFRPDYQTYGLNTSLLQYGAYAGYNYKAEKHGSMNSSIALFNQTSDQNTYRRFAYIQHSNSLLRNVDFFGSAELDFFAYENQLPVNRFHLTSLYLSLRYKPFRNLYFSTIYDNRSNVYFYETFKNYVDSLLDKETRQGFKFMVNYRPFNKLTFNGPAGYRTPTSLTGSSYNANGYLTYSELPWIGAGATLEATYLKTNYINGWVYGGSLNKDFVDGKINAEMSYRYVSYVYNVTTSTLKQHIADLNLSWRISKKLYLSSDFEATIDSNSSIDGRLFLNITQRF